MKSRISRAFIAAWLAATAGFAVVARGETPAEVAIGEAQQQVAKNPDDIAPQVALAMAYAKRARETADPGFYERGLSTVDAALRSKPESFEALKAKCWLLLGQHRFAEAHELAVSLNERVPDDLMVYGLLVDASAELGRYDDAEKAAQWMLNLRPGNVPGLTRAAYLRELFGDVEGSLELMGLALEQTPRAEAEDRAWILTQMAHLEIARGGFAAADALLTEALELFPEYHYALGQLARLRSAEGRPAEAVEIEGRRYRVAPHPENLYALAEAQARAGNRRAARHAFEEFEGKARAEMSGPDNANRELVFYYADHASKPAEALRIAQAEAKIRRDVLTLDALAWAQYRSGDYRAAQAAIEQALAVGVRDARISYHAGVIAGRLKQKEKARTLLRLVESLGPSPDLGKAARKALSDLG